MSFRELNVLSKVIYSFSFYLLKQKYICKFIFKFPPSSISLCGNIMSKKMTGQVTKESDKCEHMPLRNSLGMLKVLTESDNKLRSTVIVK